MSIRYKSLLLLLVILVLASQTFIVQAQTPDKARIAVLPLTDTNNQAKNEGYGEAIAGMLMTELINGQVFQVVERSEIDKMMQELAFQYSGAVDAGTAKQIGVILGVDILVFGTVAKFDQVVETDIRLVDTNNGEALLAENESCKNSALIREMVVNLARKMENRYIGREKGILKITSNPSGATVYLDDANAGETPLETVVVPGQHTIKIFKVNFKDWEKTITVNKGENNYSADLVSLADTGDTNVETDFDDLQDTDKKGGSKKVLYILGGAAVVGGGAALLLSNSKDDEQKSKNSKVTINVTIP